MTYFEANDGTQLFYRDWGTGKPVVFLSSWALSSEMWQFQMLHMADNGFRAIGLDRRGHGRSDDTGAGYDFDTLADDVAALVEHLDLREITLVGHSMGGGEVVRYLTRHGADRVARISLVASTVPSIAKSETNPDGIDPALFDVVNALLRKDFGQWIIDNTATFFGDGLPGCHVDQLTRDMTIRDLLKVSLHAALACNEMNQASDFQPELSEITVPALVLHGDHDVSAPVERTGQRTAELIKDCRIEIYENAAHALYLTHRERLNADLLEFARSDG